VGSGAVVGGFQSGLMFMQVLQGLNVIKLMGSVIN
jgi:hypothetical protein